MKQLRPICSEVYACNRTPAAMIVDSQSLRPAGRHVGADVQGRDRAKKAAGRKGCVAVDYLRLDDVLIGVESLLRHGDSGTTRA